MTGLILKRASVSRPSGSGTTMISTLSPTPQLKREWSSGPESAGSAGNLFERDPSSGPPFSGSAGRPSSFGCRG
jgi:hypothetical protein